MSQSKHKCVKQVQRIGNLPYPDNRLASQNCGEIAFWLDESNYNDTGKYESKQSMLDRAKIIIFPIKISTCHCCKNDLQNKIFGELPFVC